MTKVANKNSLISLLKLIAKTDPLSTSCKMLKVTEDERWKKWARIKPNVSTILNKS